MTSEPDEANPLDQLDVRVITITLQPPKWVPVIDYGEDFDDYAAWGVLQLAAEMLFSQLLECTEEDEDDDD